MKSFLLFLVLPVFVGISLIGWDGYDYYSGEYIEIEDDTNVRPGDDIEVFHYSDGCYHSEEVRSLDDRDLETYDYDTGRNHEYSMD